MIWKITFPSVAHPGTTVELRLHQDGTVTCTEDEAAVAFQLARQRQQHSSPAEGQPGAKLVHDFAELVGGQVELLNPPHFVEPADGVLVLY